MFFLSRLGGVAVGLVFMSAKLWAPGAIRFVSLIYQRANMVASGKVFVVKSLPALWLAYFD
jgi:hypothetical protein|tara:strand:+ start:224 stop:406 length:183 start_codon:yes stop_codon:yes gene_type:complete